MSRGKDQFSAVWAAAKERYSTTAGANIDDPSFPHPSSVDELLVSLDQQNKDFKHFREKRELIFGLLKNVCKPVELVANLAGGGAAMAFPPSTLCFGAVTYLLKAAHGVSESYDAIAELLGTLQTFLVRLDVYNREDLPIELQAKLAEILATYLEILAQSTKAIKHGSGSRIISFAKNAVAGPDKKFQSLITKLEKLCESESHLVGAETLVEARKTGRIVEGISAAATETNIVVHDSSAKLNSVNVGIQQISLEQTNFRSEMRQEMSNVMSALTTNQNERDGIREDKIKKILNPSIHPLDIFESIAKKRVPDTGSWIESEPLFAEWMIRKTPVLWISGTPGSGKSFLSEKIIEYLQNQHPQAAQDPSHVSVAYFFFQDSNPETRSINQALRDIAYQICQNDPLYAKHVVSSCSSARDISTISSSWRTLFGKYFFGSRNNSIAYVVIDGIDEAFEDEREAFFEHLSDIGRRNPRGRNADVGTRLQIIIVGRPQVADDLTEALEYAVPTIHVDSRKNGPDISNYVRNSIRKSRVLSRATQSLRDEITQTLVQNAQGMFIWVDLMLRELSRKTHASSIRDALQKAPQGLNEMLKHVLETFSSTLNDEEADDLNTMLSWVAYAERPLTLREVDSILKIRSPEGDDVLNLENSLRKPYASFFNLLRNDGLTTTDLQRLGGNVYAVTTDTRDDDNEVLEDVEKEIDFDSDPDTTQVVFCHASIGDYLRDYKNGKTSSGNGPAIGVDIVEARMIALRTCLRVVCTPQGAESDDSAPLQSYALSYWSSYLRDAVEDMAEIEADDKKTVGSFLIRMFHDEEMAKKWSAVKPPVFFLPKTFEPVIQWLRDPEFLEEISMRDRELVDSWIQKPAELLRATVKVMSREWLQNIRWKPAVAMKVIWVISSALEGAPAMRLPENTSAKMILQAAEWTGTPKTALWYRRVAVCLHEYLHNGMAQKYYKKALQMDDRLWLARHDLARALCLKGKLREAMALSKLNEQTVEKILNVEKVRDDADPERCMPIDLSNIRNMIAELYGYMGDRDNALIYYRKAFETYNRDYQRFISWLEIVVKNDKKDDGEIMSLMKSMEERIDGEECTRLTECIVYSLWSSALFFDVAGSVAKTTGNVAWLEEAYREAIDWLKKKRKTAEALALEVCLATLYSAWDDQDTKAVSIWEHIIEFPITSAANAQWKISGCQNMVATAYSRWLFAQAQQAGWHTSTAQTNMARIDRLCKQKTKDGKDTPEIITASFSALLLGKWHCLCGRTETAKAYFKPLIRKSILLLSDDNPANDDQAYYALSHVLLAAGDEIYAKAALSIAPAYFEGLDDDDEDDCTTTEDEEDGVDDEVFNDESTIKNDQQSIGTQEQSTDDGEEKSGDGRAETEVVDGEDTNLQQNAGNRGVLATNDANAKESEDDDDEHDMNRLERVMAAPYEVDEGSAAKIWECEGPCVRRFGNWTNANVCRICLCDLCEACIAPLRRGETIEGKVCSPDHEWLHLDAPRKSIERGKILLDDEVITLEEYLLRLRKKWHLEV